MSCAFSDCSIITDMDWQLVFFIDENDSEPVKDFILQQSDGAIAEILHVFKLLRQFGTTLGMPYVRKIHKSGIRELRIKHGSDIYRVLFCAIKGHKFILLHAFLKKEDKLLVSDVNLAIRRMNNIKSG
jgi:phage-related protein